MALWSDPPGPDEAQHRFGHTRRTLTDDAVRHLQAIARRHCAVFVWLPHAGQPSKGWFVAPDRSATLNELTARAVLADVMRASIQL